jgi:hypothetical protein
VGIFFRIEWVLCKSVEDKGASKVSPIYNVYRECV